MKEELKREIAAEGELPGLQTIIRQEEMKLCQSESDTQASLKTGA